MVGPVASSSDPGSASYPNPFAAPDLARYITSLMNWTDAIDDDQYRRQYRYLIEMRSRLEAARYAFERSMDELFELHRVLSALANWHFAGRIGPWTPSEVDHHNLARFYAESCYTQLWVIPERSKSAARQDRWSDVMPELTGFKPDGLTRVRNLNFVHAPVGPGITTGLSDPHLGIRLLPEHKSPTRASRQPWTDPGLVANVEEFLTDLTARLDQIWRRTTPIAQAALQTRP